MCTVLPYLFFFLWYGLDPCPSRSCWTCVPLTERFRFLVPTPFSCCTVSLLAPWVTWLDALFISLLSPFAPTTTYVQFFCLFLLYQFFLVSCLRLVCHISLLLSLLFCWVRSDVHIFAPTESSSLLPSSSPQFLFSGFIFTKIIFLYYFEFN